MILKMFAKIRILLLLKVLLLIVCIGPAGANETPRTVISFYYKVYKSAEMQDGYSQYKSLLENIIAVITEEVELLGKEFEYIEDLEIIPTKQDFGNLKNMKNLWNGTNSLQLVKGTVFVKDGAVTVMTTVYIGRLGEYIEKSRLLIEISVSKEELLETKGIYYALTYYSLLMDAIEIKKPSHVAGKYLSELTNHLKDLDKQKSLKKGQANIKNMLNNSLIKIEEELKKKFRQKQ
jgi:hypothetical protein